jgi:6-pyruvoyltetrahydropterin/6-carboxytetrahydropterin synthase
MKTTICKAWTFDAAHRLDRLPSAHKCHHLHGHTYRVEMQLRGEPQAGGEQEGMLIDYDDLDGIIAPIIHRVDHRFLNDVCGLAVPTTERLAAWLWGELFLSFGDLLKSVRVYESSTTWAEVTGE